jgi:hypothetical protein
MAEGHPPDAPPNDPGIGSPTPSRQPVLAITDPSELKPADVYRQARLVASKTSRGSDNNWYKEALDLPHQWHLWFDGGREVASATFSRSENTWREGPPISLANLTTVEGVADLLAELLSAKYFGQRPTSLGVVMHVADEFALAGLAAPADSSGEGSDDLDVIRFNLIDDPKESLADREVSVEATSWRLLPFWGAVTGQAKGTAIALSRSRETFLKELLTHAEELRVPIRIAVTAAPVEHLGALPLIEPTMAGGRLVVLPYLKFTAVFAIAESGELRGVRSLAHRGGAQVPTGLPDILASMAVSAELTGVGPNAARPRVLVASLDPTVLEAVTRSLASAGGVGKPAIDLERIDLATHPALDSVPGRRPEFLVYNPKAVDSAREAGAPLAKTQTFAALWKDWLTGSNFFDTARLDALYPTLKDLHLLRLATALTLLLTLALVASAGYCVFAFYKASTHPSWSLTPMQLKKTEADQVKLQTERRQIDIANRLLQPRSKGWTSLEFLLQLFPEDAGVRIDTFDYGVESSRLGPSQVKGKPPETAGLIRTWTVRGLAKPQALEVLANINSQRGLTALFDRVAKATGDPSYTPDPQRQLQIALTQGRNSRFLADPSVAKNPNDPAITFPFSFEATITQTLTDKDALAMPTEKPF